MHNNPLIFVDPYGLWREEARDCIQAISRGFLDDSTWNASTLALGEFKPSTIYEKWPYYGGTGGSVVAGFFYGGTLAKLCVKACTKTATICVQKTSNIALKQGIAKETARTNTGRTLISKTVEIDKNKKILQNDVGSRKRLKPHPEAQGDHSSFRRDPTSNETNRYETYRKQTNPYDPKPWESVKRYDNAGGKSHYNQCLQEYVFEPHVHDPCSPGGIRHPELWEIPKR